jgi:hypothetical protein
MGCQVGIADKIVAHKADYLLALKGNQPTLETDVEDYFRTAPAAVSAKGMRSTGSVNPLYAPHDWGSAAYGSPCGDGREGRCEAERN